MPQSAFTAKELWRKFSDQLNSFMPRDMMQGTESVFERLHKIYQFYFF